MGSRTFIKTATALNGESIWQMTLLVGIYVPTSYYVTFQNMLLCIRFFQTRGIRKHSAVVRYDHVFLHWTSY